MDNIERLVRERRSFRTFDGNELTGAEVDEGQHLGGTVSEEDLKLWADGLVQ